MRDRRRVLDSLHRSGQPVSLDRRLQNRVSTDDEPVAREDLVVILDLSTFEDRVMVDHVNPGRLPIAAGPHQPDVLEIGGGTSPPAEFKASSTVSLAVQENLPGAGTSPWMK